MAEFGSIDIVVANAGIARKVDLDQLDDEAWQRVLEVDLNGAWRCFRAALPHMRRAGYGRLLATSSVAGTVQAWPAHPHYAAAKAGLVGLIQTLAVEYGPDGITANAVAPGVIDTPQANDPVNSLGPDGVRAAAPKVPSGRVGRAGGHRLPVPVPGQRGGVLRQRPADRRRRGAPPGRAGLADVGLAGLRDHLIRAGHSGAGDVPLPTNSRKQPDWHSSGTARRR